MSGLVILGIFKGEMLFWNAAMYKQNVLRMQFFFSNDFLKVTFFFSFFSVPNLRH